MINNANEEEDEYFKKRDLQNMREVEKINVPVVEKIQTPVVSNE